MQEIFDVNKIIKNEARQTRFDLFEKVCNAVFEELEDAFYIHNKIPKTVLDMNPKNGYFTSVLKEKFAEITIHTIKNPFNQSLPKEQQFDFISSIFNLHKTSNLKISLLEIKSILNQGGIFTGSFFGTENLFELGALLAKHDFEIKNMVFNRMLPLIDIKTFGTMLLAAGFKNPVVWNVKFDYNFNNLMEAILFLKEIGETNCLKMRESSFLSANILKKILAKYKQKVTLTFDVCIFLCLT